MSAAAGGHTALVANYVSGQVEAVDVAGLPDQVEIGRRCQRAAGRVSQTGGLFGQQGAESGEGRRTGHV